MKPSSSIIQVATAYPGLTLEPTPKKRTYFGQIGLEDNSKKDAFIKLVTPGELSREAFLTVLGRELALPIPRPFYVQVDPTYVGTSAQVSRLGVAFALEAERLPNQRVFHEDILNNIGQWSEVYRCAAFDSLIGNRDRVPSNLLFAGNSGYWLIDHEEAMPAHLTDSEAVGSQLCALVRDAVGSELELYRAREKMLAFVETVNNVDWSHVRGCLRLDELPEIASDVEKFILLIQSRIVNMRDILSVDLGIKQAEIPFAFAQDGSKEAEQ